MANDMRCHLLFLWFGKSQVITQLTATSLWCHLFSGGITKKKKWTIVHPNIPSALRQVPQGAGISIPEPPKEFTINPDDKDEGESTSGSPEPPASTEPHVSHGRSSVPQPHILTQDELNDLVCDLEMSKSKTELLGSRLKQWNLLKKNVRISSFRSHQQLAPFFRKEDDLVFCYNADGMTNALGIKHNSQEWQLFIDSSKLSLKALLLHNGNQHPIIPVRHTVHMKETYENLKQLQNKLEYSKYGWHICGDLKVVSLLMGLQLGYINYCCFLCEWDSRAKTLYYLKREWPQRKSLKVGEKNVQNPALAE
jgi:hypothetical protein